MLGEQSTKSQILEATIALLKSGGESAVKVGLIAEELGIAAPSLYHRASCGFRSNRQSGARDRQGLHC